MLEETGLPYEPHRVDFDRTSSTSPEFLSLSPNNKIPAILDPDGPGGRPFRLFESARSCVYLADKAGKLLPADAAGRYETMQWLMFQMGGIGPMFGQVGFFHKFAGKDYEDKRPRDRYVAEAKRLLGVLDGHLADRAWIMGSEYTHRRHRHVSVDAQPGRLLWRRRPRRIRRLRPCHARARGLRRPTGRRPRAADSAGALTEATRVVVIGLV